VLGEAAVRFSVGAESVAASGVDWLSDRTVEFAAVWELPPASVVAALLSAAALSVAELSAAGIVSPVLAEAIEALEPKGSLLSSARGAVSSTRLRVIPALSVEGAIEGA